MWLVQPRRSPVLDTQLETPFPNSFEQLVLSGAGEGASDREP